MKKTFITLLSSIIMLCFCACGGNKENTGDAEVSPAAKEAVVINLQPLDGIRNVDKIKKELAEKYLDRLGLDNYQIRILPHRNSPDSCFNGRRYRAEKLIGFLNANTPPKEFTIGLTDHDISFSIHGSDDFGILGLSYLRHKKNACIVSSFRVKNKADLWKVAAHEFTHGFFDQPHCSANDPHCIMQDANKKPNFAIKEYICDECLRQVETKMKK